MFSRIGTVVPLIFCAAAVAGATPPAHADEAFLCGPDEVVYVKSSELEAKKKSDPCIASYFGGAPKAEAAVAQAPAISGSETQPAAPAVEPISMKPLASSEVPELSAKKLAYGGAVAAAPPRAMPGTDYRNVRIINAEAGGAQWFKHAR